MLWTAILPRALIRLVNHADCGLCGDGMKEILWVCDNNPTHPAGGGCKETIESLIRTLTYSRWFTCCHSAHTQNPEGWYVRVEINELHSIHPSIYVQMISPSQALRHRRH